MVFFTNVVDLEAALNASLTVRDWQMLTEAVEILTYEKSTMFLYIYLA